MSATKLDILTAILGDFGQHSADNYPVMGA